MKKLNPRPIEPRPVLGAHGVRQAITCRAALLAAVAFSLGACHMGEMDALDVALAPIPASDSSAVPPEPAPEGADRFEPVGTNPFVMAAHDPLSTFATDADTASYDLFVREVGQGTLPAPESVRLEDYVNYFDYAYPAAPPDAALPFSVELAAAASPWREGTALVSVGISGKQPPPEEKKPANLVFLVDVSGSMEGADRLPLAKRVLERALELLAPSDRVSIVTYAGDTSVRLAPTAVSDASTIREAIDGLGNGGGTYGAGGLDLAYAQAREGFIQGGINHVVLCTDGDFNIGPSSTSELLELIATKRRGGVTLTALGFGEGNLNDGMLEAVSNAGNGFYGVITSPTQADDYVDQRLLSTMTLIAKDVKVQVEFNPEQVAAYRLLGYENRAIADQDFRVDSVDAGEIGAGHQVTALYEVVLTGGSVPRVSGAPSIEDGAAYPGERVARGDALAHVSLRYKAVDAGETDAALEVAADLPRASMVPDFEGASADLRFASSVAAFAEILKHSPYAAPEQLDLLEQVFREAAPLDAARAELLELFLRARGELWPRP